MNRNRSTQPPTWLKNRRQSGLRTVERNGPLDDVGWRILAELQCDARLPFAELGRRVGLSTPAVIERVRRLEDAGVITGYHAAVDPARIGLGVAALIRVRAGALGDAGARLARVLADSPEVFECHHVTGDDCYICRVHLASVAHLERFIEGLSRHGSTTTSIVLSSPVERRIISAPISPEEAPSEWNG